MDIASKFDSPYCLYLSECTLDLPFKDDHFQVSFRRSVDFQNLLNFMIFKKCKNCSMGFDRTVPVSNVL